MSRTALRKQLSRDLLSFAWDEWAQMGVFAGARRQSPWVQDPEALLVFTLEVARDDPRLFDEVLDWMVVNERLLAGWRLRAMCAGPEDERLLAAALAWVARHGGRDRGLTGRSRSASPDHEPLFRAMRMPISKPDEAFAGRGFLRPVAAASGKSQPPDLRAPINLAFRLRQMLGVTARAEVVRSLLALDAPRVSRGVITRAAGFSARNVSEALSALHSAGVVTLTVVGNERYYAIDRARWSAFLELQPDHFAAHRDWPQLLSALRRMLRFVSDPDLDDLSSYIRASRARDVLEATRADLFYAGVPVDFGRTVDDAWDALASTVDRASAALRPPGDSYETRDPVGPASDRHLARPRGALDVFRDASGACRWRLRAPNGHVVAVSPGALGSERAAMDAARRFADQADDLRAEVYEDAGGHFRWRTRLPGGALIASSGDVFATRSNARRAAKGATRIARDALRR